ALAQHITAPVLRVSNALYRRSAEDLTVETGRSDELAVLSEACALCLGAAAEEEEEAKSLLLPGIQSPASLPAPGVRQLATVAVIRVVSSMTALELLQPSILARLLAEFSLYAEQSAKLYGGLMYRFTGEQAIL